ncbi:C40 family peptidase [uncultured Bacteroides sp.]|uniref:C40 family peptidase n=1 Tax=uncultured Bacteroides sp. TaxID=162156 RepID=UPI00261F9DFF|nr:C40 family peptidase [uncultured Bacteroides sp.]
MHRHTHTSGRLVLIGLLLTLILSSCGTRAPRYDYIALAQAAIRLDMDIDMEDNHKLYIESSQWIGVPYRLGGNTKKGVDCSGLTVNIYKTVYKKKLKRNSDQQRTENCSKVSKRNLQEGDLVFFHNGRNKKKANHVGIYLKDNRFIHASNSGVIISSLNESYYKKYWLQGGRVKGL